MSASPTRPPAPTGTRPCQVWSQASPSPTRSLAHARSGRGREIDPAPACVVGLARAAEDVEHERARRGDGGLVGDARLGERGHARPAREELARAAVGQHDHGREAAAGAAHGGDAPEADALEGPGELPRSEEVRCGPVDEASAEPLRDLERADEGIAGAGEPELPRRGPDLPHRRELEPHAPVDHAIAVRRVRDPEAPLRQALEEVRARRRGRRPAAPARRDPATRGAGPEDAHAARQIRASVTAVRPDIGRATVAPGRPGRSTGLTPSRAGRMYHAVSQPSNEKVDPPEPPVEEGAPESAPATPGSDRKERVLHTRVPALLERELKRFAENLRVPVSNLVRAILEDAIVAADAAGESVEGRLKRAAAQIEHERERLKKRVTPDPFAGVFAFQPVTLAQPSACAKCHGLRSRPRRAAAHLGLSETPGRARPPTGSSRLPTPACRGPDPRPPSRRPRGCKAGPGRAVRREPPTVGPPSRRPCARANLRRSVFCTSSSRRNLRRRSTGTTRRSVAASLVTRVRGARGLRARSG